MANPVITSFEREDLIGSICRAIALSLVLGGCLVLSLSITSLLSIEIPSRYLVVVFLVILVSMNAGMILSEYPRGVDYVMMRIGFATFCRTGLPLVVVMVVARYSDPNFATESVGFLVAFYTVGLVTSIGLSLYRFSGSSSSPKSHEVDSAAA